MLPEFEAMFAPEADPGSPQPLLLVIGELNVDLILEQVSALPELEKERTAEGMTLTLGSSSAILAANASAIGVNVAFIGLVGADPFGRFCVDRLRARGVDTRHVKEVPDLTTGLTAIYTYGDKRGAITYPGAMAHLTVEHVPDEVLQSADHLHLSSFYLQSGIRPDCSALFQKARELGLTTSLDPNWDPAEEWRDVLDVVEYVDVFLPNADEARWITGESDLDRAIEALSRRTRTVVVTCGVEGVRARRGDETYVLPAIPVEPVDAVGAGDSFNAGFLSRYLLGKPMEECLHFGMLAGAFSTLAAGGTGAFDAPERFHEFVRQAHTRVTSAPG